MTTNTSDRNKRIFTDTDTTNGNHPHKSLINGLIPETIPVVIPLVDQTTADGVAASGETLHARRTITPKDIVTNTARSTARVFRTPVDVRRHDMDRTTPWDNNTVISSTSLASPVLIVDSATVSPTSNGRQEIISPRGSIGPQEVRDAQPLDTSVNVIYYKHRDPAPTWSKVICRKFSNKSSDDLYSQCCMNLMHDAVFIVSPNFMNMGISSIHTSDELGSVLIPITRIRRPTDGYNMILYSHCIGKNIADRVSRTGSEHDYIAKTDFETRGENQNFGRQNNLYESTEIGLDSSWLKHDQRNNVTN